MLHFYIVFGVFAKLRKADINCVMSVRPSICVSQLGKTWIKLHGFL